MILLKYRYLCKAVLLGCAYSAFGSELASTGMLGSISISSFTLPDSTPCHASTGSPQIKRRQSHRNHCLLKFTDHSEFSCVWFIHFIEALVSRTALSFGSDCVPVMHFSGGSKYYLSISMLQVNALRPLSVRGTILPNRHS
eukprot:1804647-Amphidinium_carterae.1